MYSNIWTEELLRYGMGLGIFSELENLECARNRVSNLLETLKNCFLLSQVPGKDYVKMHDVVRDMAIHIASEGNHIFLVSHNVNSKEFPRKDSYKQYSHMSIVANKFDARPRPISCPRLKLLMLKLRFEEGFKLQDDFFDGMSELSVIKLSGYDRNSILPFPSSIQRLSNLSTLWLSNLRLDDVSIIGELVTLEILSIRGVLSRLVRLEELHMVGVEDCSYSTLRELESLSRLTALTLDGCSKDVIYSNLGLSSKLTRYALKMGRHYTFTSFMETYNKAIDLDVTKGTPLGDWIRLLLRYSECVSSSGKGSKNVVFELQNVKDLRLSDCDSLNIHYQNNISFPKLERLEVIYCGHLRHLFCVSLACPDDEEEGISRGTHIRPDVIKFPNLYYLELGYLGCFTHFCSDTVEGIEFPLLREMHFSGLTEFQNFWPTANNAITDSNPLFNEKVSCPNLEKLYIEMASSVSSLLSHQLPTTYFSKLETLKVGNCGKLRHLMSPSVARGLLNLRKLRIGECQSMEEVITEEEQQGDEIMCNEPLFPQLEELELENLPKLRHFILTKQALEFPFLIEVQICNCPEMKMLVQQRSVSTSSLKSVNNDDELKVVDLNKAMFNSKKAMEEELLALKENDTWNIVSCPSNVHLIGCKWVYSIKLHSDGTLDRYKARSVVLDNKQEYGVNYEENFALVAKMTMVRTIVSIVALQNWNLHQTDVKNAFLHGDLKKDIYMKPPPGLFSFPTSDVCKLKQSLYGLKQDHRTWFDKFRSTLLQFSFEQRNYDSFLFLRKTSTGCVLLLVYVDDIIIIGTDSLLITSLQQQLKDSFHMKDLGTLTYFFGLEVHRDSSGLQDSSSMDTPLELNVKYC
ncbi:hypothetical protein P3S68_029270 [Capsicum galapagoense]